VAALTLRLDDDECDALRRRAAQEGRSMQQVVHEALREYFERHDAGSWADVASRPPLFTGSPSEIDEAIRASDRDWAGEGPVRSLRELLASWGPLGPPGVMSDVMVLIREDRETH
jgi:plasmid stability protein